MKRPITSAAKVGRYIARWYTSPARRSGRAALPTTLSLLATDNCNSKCVMCDIWKTKAEGELTAEEFGAILRDPLFSKVEHVGISGGEPTLRKDLVGIVREVVEALPELISLSVTSHGFHTSRWKSMLKGIRDCCDRSGVQLRINVSLDGVNELHNEVRGMPKAFDTACGTIDEIRAQGVDVQIQTTVTSPNVFGVGRMLEWALERDHDIVFRQGTVITRLDNEESVNKVALSADERSFFADLLRSDRLLNRTTSPARKLFYLDLADRLITGRERHAPCIFQNEGLVLAANGDMFHCSISTEAFGNARRGDAIGQYYSERSESLRANLKSTVCPGCVHDQSGIWAPSVLIGNSLRKSAPVKRALWIMEAMPVAAGLIGRSLAARCHKPPAEAAAGAPLRKIVIIGAYGGEHVGDAAILGGVLRRLHERHGVAHAEVASIRPDRTRRWVATIHSSVEIGVFDYERNAVEDRLQDSDAIVLAGGPLMDLPKLLNNHLRSILHAKRLGKRFLVEGIGVGPFKNPLTRRAGRSILTLADAIVVRSESDRISPVSQGLSVLRDRDPAFDYLETRGESLKLEFSEALGLTRLFEGLDGRILVGVNLRPLWGKYARKGDDIDAIMSTFLDRLAEGLVELDRQTDGRLTVISFPMNPDQYGFSDLGSAQQLDEKIAGRVHHRVWECEPGIDAVLSLLRRLDCVLAMRFHACIFSLSQGVPTFGIDYSLGPQGKVGSLMKERGLSDKVVKMDALSADWMVRNMGPALASLGPPRND